MVVVATTARLSLRQFTTDDAPFILELVNDPDWLQHIGDRNVHSTADAVAYLVNGPIAFYARHGYGLWCVELRATSVPVGMCGLVRRDWLDRPDIGFAMLPVHRRAGYGLEAARAVLDGVATMTGSTSVAAIVSPDNIPSQRLLTQLGLHAESTVRPPGSDRDVLLYSTRPEAR